MPFTPTKVTDETFQVFARYFEASGGKWDIKALERATGLTYKSLWARLDKAKKAMKAEGWEPATLAEDGGEGGSAAATPKKKAAGKRKVKAEADDGELEGGDGEVASPKKKVKKVKEEEKEEEPEDGNW